MDVTDVFLVILLVSASILCWALVFYLNRITKSVGRIEADINDISDQFKPLIVTTTDLSDKLKENAFDVKRLIGNAQSVVDEVKYRVDSILEIETKVRHRLEGPIFELTKNISALINGVNAFWNAYRK
ncbi:MAG: hypothetical protein AUK34_13625 [Ignavibacteria bacterium CG2_30_36_16]|nr:hypothetical protein [Ignavibacteria bacterium]OIP55296.1 MAG: hypothetical protein AUK34_13625 [Ignavibacteria bacterium CG2_30_36_16]PJB00637.1 MAG: hypothetical protein CO127_07865 [Ignavibacteria bacterium CG_4_9_14_3_um_filter_36_18]